MWRAEPINASANKVRRLSGRWLLGKDLRELALEQGVIIGLMERRDGIQAVAHGTKSW